MPKQPYFESAVHHFLTAAMRLGNAEYSGINGKAEAWKSFINSMNFAPGGSSTVAVTWKKPRSGNSSFSYTGAKLYFRGDTPDAAAKQKSLNFQFTDDRIYEENDHFFTAAVKKIAGEAGFSFTGNNVNPLHETTADDVQRFDNEEVFHDEWAKSVDISEVNVDLVNTINTSPEMRYIHEILGNIKGKTLLDVGCGIGEVGVYCAKRGCRDCH